MSVHLVHRIDHTGVEFIRTKCEQENWRSTQKRDEYLTWCGAAGFDKPESPAFNLVQMYSAIPALAPGTAVHDARLVTCLQCLAMEDL